LSINEIKKTVISETTDKFMTSKKRYDIQPKIGNVSKLSEDYSTEYRNIEEPFPIEVKIKDDNVNTALTMNQKERIKSNQTKLIIYNDREATLKPIQTSVYKTSYNVPLKEHYRRVRTETYVRQYDEPSIAKNATSIYKSTF
jgi:hypothetical protein